MVVSSCFRPCLVAWLWLPPAVCRLFRVPVDFCLPLVCVWAEGRVCLACAVQFVGCVRNICSFCSAWFHVLPVLALAFASVVLSLHWGPNYASGVFCLLLSCSFVLFSFSFSSQSFLFCVSCLYSEVFHDEFVKQASGTGCGSKRCAWCSVISAKGIGP